MFVVLTPKSKGIVKTTSPCKTNKKSPCQSNKKKVLVKARQKLKKQVIRNCMDSAFIHQGRSLVLIGPPGLGKTHLAVSIGIKMIQIGYSVKFLMAQKLINDHRKCAQPSHATGIQETEESQKLLRSLAKVDLLIIDEFGYLPHDKEAGPLFYQIISDRYEQRGTIITSNKSLTAWAEVLHDSSLAAALIDRLMHHGEVFYLSGDSYRLRGKKKYLAGNTTSAELERLNLSENREEKGGDK